MMSHGRIPVRDVTVRQKRQIRLCRHNPKRNVLQSTRHLFQVSLYVGEAFGKRLGSSGRERE